MKILGIDPGTATTGYGIIEARKNELKVVTFGCIKTAKQDKAEKRLAEIYRDLTKLIKKYRPKVAAVESIFFYKNVKTAIAVAQARGVVLFCIHKNKIKLAEFAPLEVKRTLTNYGKADKKQVQYMVKQLLNLKQIPKPDDAADALAVAICAANISIDPQKTLP